MKKFLTRFSFVKSLAVLMVLAAAATTGAAFWPTDGFCWSCSGAKCSSDLQCGSFCRCAKSDSLYGNCAPE